MKRPFRIVPRLDDDGTAVLFLPDIPANSGFIACYAHKGQHSEASWNYYHNHTYPVDSDLIPRIINEYRTCFEPDVVIRKRISRRKA